MPNSNLVDGGSAAPFSQDSILEFQALTSGYKAEFGHGSGGIVNVVTKSGTGKWHGLVSAFHRNDALDSPDAPGTGAPFLKRWDLGANLGGPSKGSIYHVPLPAAEPVYDDAAEAERSTLAHNATVAPRATVAPAATVARYATNKDDDDDIKENHHQRAGRSQIAAPPVENHTLAAKPRDSSLSLFA